MHNLDETVTHLGDADFKTLMVNKMNAISNAIVEIKEQMDSFRTTTIDQLKNEVFGKIRENQEKSDRKYEKLNLDYKLFKAKVVGGCLVLVTVVEIAKEWIK